MSKAVNALHQKELDKVSKIKITAKNISGCFIVFTFVIFVKYIPTGPEKLVIINENF